MKISGPNNSYQPHMHVFCGLAIMFIVSAYTVTPLNWKENPVFGRVIDDIANESSIYLLFIAGYLIQHLSVRSRMLIGA